MRLLFGHHISILIESSIQYNNNHLSFLKLSLCLTSLRFTVFTLSVNNLLLVGFYLVNLGYAVYTLRVTYNVSDTRQLIEELSAKTGAIILILGGMHFFNMLVFFKLRKRALVEGSQKQGS